MKTAKLVINDDNQTVILPKEFQIQDNEVYIKQIGNVLILIPQANPWQTLRESLNLFSDDFMENREQPSLEMRETWQ